MNKQTPWAGVDATDAQINWREFAAIDDGPVRQADFGKCLARLTSTELKILSLMAQGLMNKQIAYRCGAAHSTIKSHVTHILRKLKTRSRTSAAVHYAVFIERRRITPQD